MLIVAYHAEVAQRSTLQCKIAGMSVHVGGPLKIFSGLIVVAELFEYLSDVVVVARECRGILNEINAPQQKCDSSFIVVLDLPGNPHTVVYRSDLNAVAPAFSVDKCLLQIAFTRIKSRLSDQKGAAVDPGNHHQAVVRRSFRHRTGAVDHGEGMKGIGFTAFHVLQKPLQVFLNMPAG